LPVVSVSLTVR